MADKRIHELATTTDKSGKFLALDEAGLSEALKFSADSLIDKAFTDTLYVKLAGNETVNGIKTWNNQPVFEAGILVNLGGIDVTGNSNIAGTLGVDGALTVTAGGIIVTGVSSIAGKLTISTGGIDITGNQTITGTIFQTDGVNSITLANDVISFSRNTTNYFHASTVGGNFAFVTNGAALSGGNANLVLGTTSSYFNTALGVGIVGPTAPLDVVDVTATMLRLNRTNNVNASIHYQNNVGSIHAGIGTNEHFYVATTNNLEPTALLTVETGGNLVVAGNVLADTHFRSIGTSVILGTISAGQCYLRPNGYASSTAQSQFSTTLASIGTNTFIDGFLGVKDSSPETRLDLGGVTAGPAVRFFQTAAATGDSNFRLFMGTGTGVLNGDYLFEMGLRYDSTDDNNCGIRWVRGSGTIGGYLSFYYGAAAELMWVGKDTGIVEINHTSQAAAGGRIRLSNYHSSLQDGSTAGEIEFYKSDASTGGAGVVSRIKSYNIPAGAGGTFNLGFFTGDSSSSTTQRFTMEYVGNFKIENSQSNGGLIVDASVVKNHGLRFDVGGLTRWYLYANGTAEGGSDSGSNITFASYTDAGAFKTGVMNIDRATSHMGLGGINPSYQLDVQTNQTTEAAVVRFYNDYKSKIGKNLILRQAEDTPSGSPPAVCLQCQDGNGTEVGSLGYDTGSGFRLIDSLSSKKFKKNIKASKIKGIEKLKAVRPKNYKWKGRTPEEEIIVTERGQDQEEIEGYLIEDLEAEMPDVVSEYTGENGETVKGYSATGIIKYLHKGILELTERLEALETP